MLSSDASVARVSAAALLTVTAIAAVVSYMHIEALAAGAGQSPLAAHLLPVSVDGTVAAASMDLVWAARRRQRSAWIARTWLLLGVAATLAANVAYGWPHGWAAAVMSGWPAAAFVGCAEMAIARMRKAARQPAARPAAVSAAEAAPGHRRVRAPAPAGSLTSGQLAELQGVSVRTARRRMAALRSAPASAEAGQ